jgi:hypothetical protein
MSCLLRLAAAAPGKCYRILQPAFDTASLSLRLSQSQDYWQDAAGSVSYLPAAAGFVNRSATNANSA